VAKQRGRRIDGLLVLHTTWWLIPSIKKRRKTEEGRAKGKLRWAIRCKRKKGGGKKERPRKKENQRTRDDRKRNIVIRLGIVMRPKELRRDGKMLRAV